MPEFDTATARTDALEILLTELIREFSKIDPVKAAEFASRISIMSEDLQMSTSLRENITAIHLKSVLNKAIRIG